MKQLLIATTNTGKVAELSTRLQGLGWTLGGLDDHPDVPAAEEPALTFAGNARVKALHYARHTGRSVLADDSGLEVAALDGAPGVRSARFAGEHATDADNNALLLQRLGDADDRSARFVCALCLVEDGEVTLEVSGACNGTIDRAPRGLRGFGYDPLFVPDDPRAGGHTFAELSRQAKAALSHRGRALEALVTALRERAEV